MKPSRFMRWLAGRFEAWALRLRFAAAEPYDPDTWPTFDLTDEEWESFRKALEEIGGKGA